MSHTSNGSKRLGDLGIFIYGFVEVLGATLSGNQHAWTNAIGVQIIVAFLEPKTRIKNRIIIIELKYEYVTFKVHFILHMERCKHHCIDHQ